MNQRSERPSSRDWFHVIGIVFAAVVGALLGAWAQQRMKEREFTIQEDRLSALETSLAERESQVAELERQARDHPVALNALRQKLDKQEAMTASLAKRLNALSKNTSDYETSRPGWNHEVGRAEAHKAANNECSSFFFDVDAGLLNGIPPDVSQSELMELLPCYDGVILEGEGPLGVIHYSSNGFSFFTAADYFSLTPAFTGTTSRAILTLGRVDVFKEFGVPFREERSHNSLYSKAYGCLQIFYTGRRYNENRAVTEVRVHANACEEISDP